MTKKPRIAIAGLGIETSTFSPARTSAAAFHPSRGKEIIERYKFLEYGTELGDTAIWEGALIGHALPGGIVKRDAFESLAGEIVQRLHAIVTEAPLDGLWYDIHGAMCVEDMDDSEAELLQRIRRVIGPKCVVSTSMDLHGNVSEDLVHQSDLITCYRTAPHIDVTDTKIRACQYLMQVLRQPDRRLPLKAWIPIPILLAGEQTSTRVEPGKHLYDGVYEVATTPGVLDASIWIGYAWADEPRNKAAVIVTGYYEPAVTSGAEKLARTFWAAHADFDFVAPTGTLSSCLATAVMSKKRPYFISDSGDNPTAGGAGDVTWTLRAILNNDHFAAEYGPKLVYASIPAGSAAMLTIVQAGVGALVTVTVGAQVDNIHSGPVRLTGTVHSIKHGDRDAVVEAVLQVDRVYVILTELRKPYHHESDFTDLELDIRAGDADIVVVKIGYLEPELYDMASGWMMALTPGGVNQDLLRLGHKRIDRPMWPFDKQWDEQPDLPARLIPKSYEALDGP